MSAEGFALGLLAGHQTADSTVRAVNGLMASLRNRGPQIDVNALINEALSMEHQLAQRDAHIAQQDTYIKGLKREVAELRALAKEIAGERNAFVAWAARAEAELKRWRSGG